MRIYGLAAGDKKLSHRRGIVASAKDMKMYGAVVKHETKKGRG